MQKPKMSFSKLLITANGLFMKSCGVSIRGFSPENQKDGNKATANRLNKSKHFFISGVTKSYAHSSKFVAYFKFRLQNSVLLITKVVIRV